MKNRILSILTALAITVSLSACQAGDTGQTPPLSEVVVSETTQSLETTIQSEIEQTSNLTFEDINIIEINGKQVSLPFKVEDLGEGYSIGEEYGFNESYSALYYNKQCLALINLNDNEYIYSIAFDSDGFIDNSLNIYGLSFENNFTEIINILGNPTRQKELALIYEYNNGKLYFGSENGSLGFNYVKISLNGGTENE